MKAKLWAAVLLVLVLAGACLAQTKLSDDAIADFVRLKQVVNNITVRKGAPS